MILCQKAELWLTPGKHGGRLEIPLIVQFMTLEILTVDRVAPRSAKSYVVVL